MTENSAVAYHQLARANGRLRAVAEVVLAATFWFVLTNIVGIVFFSLSESALSSADGALGLVVLVFSIGTIMPATWFAARALQRSPKQLSSVVPGLRWPLLRTMLVVAVAVKVVHLGVDFVASVAIDGWAATVADIAWPGLTTFVPLALL